MTGLLCSGGVLFIHLHLPFGGHRLPVTSLLRQLSERLRLFQLVQPFTGSDGVMVFQLLTHWARNGSFLRGSWSLWMSDRRDADFWCLRSVGLSVPLNMWRLVFHIADLVHHLR